MNWFMRTKRRSRTSAVSHCPRQRICGSIVAIVPIDCCTYDICIDIQMDEYSYLCQIQLIWAPFTNISIEHITWPKLLSCRNWLKGRDWSSTIEIVWKSEGSHSLWRSFQYNAKESVGGDQVAIQNHARDKRYSAVRLSRLPTLSYENR